MSTKVQYEAEPDRTVHLTDPEGQWMAQAKGEETKSSDWWRHIGAAAYRDGVLLLTAHNEHFPTEHAPYEDGDPRGSFHRGGDLDKTTAGHAEVLLIARAAAAGIPLGGADLLVSTFPCPPCAISIANAGFRRLFYSGGYSMISAAPILRSRSIEIIRVVE
jgi:deoxycytidylate deaminase